MSIASELQVLLDNKAAIKAAIEAENPTVAPTEVMSNWPASIASIGQNPSQAQLSAIKSAILARNPTVAPTNDFDTWPSAIASIP